MAGQSGKSKTSPKRAPEETRSRQNRRAARSKDRDAAQHRCAQASLLAARLRDDDVADIRARRERGEEYRTIGKAYGLDEFTVARIVRHGRLSPWRHAQAQRAERRRPLREAWAKKNGKSQLAAG